MKILHLASEYPPAKVYGLGRFVHGLARAQAALGDEVHVLTNSSGGAEDGVLREGVHVHRIAFPNPPRPADGIGEVLQFQACLAGRLLSLREQLGSVDVIASHDWLVGPAAREVARALDRPLVVTFHDEVTGKHFGLLDPDARFVRDLERLTAHDANHVIANSRYVAEQLRRQLGLAPERITAIPGGIDPRLLDLPRPELLPAFRRSMGDPGDVLALYVGRLDPEKGLEALGAAFPRALERCPRLRLLVAGSGKCEERLREQLAPAAERVRFLGYVRGEALAYLYRAVDLALVPSLYEPFGLVALEGMLAGRAVVAAATGGLKEIVRAEKDGLLVPPGDPEALAAAIVRLADDPELRARLGSRASQEAVREHAWSEIATRTIDVYRRVLGERPRPCPTLPPEPDRPLVSIVTAASESPRTTYPAIEVVASEAEARGDYVCKLDGAAQVPPGSEGWLEALVWLLEDQGAASVSPTLHGGQAEPRRGEGPPGGCVLRKKDAPAQTGTHWVHPVRLARAEPPPVSIVIVAWGCLPWTRLCVDSVLAHTPRPFELVLVDNGSPDGTRAWFQELRERLEDDVSVTVVENTENHGYPVGANQGIRAARGRDVVLLNNDARVRPGWLEALLEARGARPRVGIVAAKVLNEDGSVQSAGGVLHHPDGRFTIPGADEDRLAPPVHAARELESAGGPCMLLTRELLEAVGAFDEAYSPGYFEDSDLCLRAREAGFVLRYAPAAEVVHRAKVTSNAVAREGKLDVWGLFRENERRFWERWAARLEADETERRAREAPGPRRRILLCYGASSTTTAAYGESALRRDHAVVTAGPGQVLDLGEEVSATELTARASERLGGEIDLLLAVEGMNYLPQGIEEAPCRTAWWAIDSHLHARDEGGWHFAYAPRFDLVLVAQKDHVGDYRARGCRAEWLPLACDPGVHHRFGPETGRDLDLVFVGNVLPIHARRRRLLDRLRARFALVERQGVWREDMARLFARAKIVFNCSLAGDLNMRVFEGLASGALLLTDRVENGLATLFGPDEHLALYDDDSLEREVERWLANRALREQVAARGQALVLRHHTYLHRMRELVRLAMAVPTARRGARARPESEVTT